MSDPFSEEVPAEIKEEEMNEAETPEQQSAGAADGGVSVVEPTSDPPVVVNEPQGKEASDPQGEEGPPTVIGDIETEDTTPAVDESTSSPDALPALAPTNEEEEPKQRINSATATDAAAPELTLRDEEAKFLRGAEILFSRTDTKHYNGWDNLRWMAYSGTRRLKYFEPVYRFVEKPKTFMAWASGEEYLNRQLAVYDEPNLILVLRPPESIAELKEVLDLDDEQAIDDSSSTHWVVESVVDPNTCKLRLSPLTTITSISQGVQENEFRRRSCFELITPLSTMILSAIRLRSGGAVKTSFIDSGAFLETSSAEHVLKRVICNAHQKETGSAAINGHDLSWKHQIILGTLHSYVILGNKELLDEGIAHARKMQQRELRKMGESTNASNINFLDPRIVDALDESGKTPLHYACASRFTAAVLSLVAAGANVNLKVEPHNTTPCHISAQRLDDKSLRAILAMNRRPNLVDAFGRTPMYVAITEGSAVGGKADPQALSRCLAVLQVNGGDLGDLTNFRHPFSYLALLLHHEVLLVVLNHVSHRYPLNLHQKNSQLKGVSASAYFHYPVHSALIGFREKMQALCEEKKSQELWNFCAVADAKLVKTMEVLLRSGFEPNERLEGMLDVFNGSEQLAAYVGFSPIQILGLTALDAAQYKESLGETLLLGVLGLIANLAESMVKNGARLTLDAPPSTRLRNAPILRAQNTSTGNEGSRVEIRVMDLCDQLKIASNAELADLLGGMDRLSKAQLAWDSIKSVPLASGTFKFHSDKLAIDDSQAPGGSDEKSCAICWKPFGKLMNRKHRCRISRRHVCDDCSSKRILSDGEEHRVSDGQFLLAKAEKVKAVAKPPTPPVMIGSHQTTKAKEKTGKLTTTQTTSVVESRLDRLEAEDQANRDSLFGGFLDNATKAVFGEETEGEDKAKVQAGNTAGLSGQLNQTRDALNQRGDKLNTLAEKSDRLASASEDFASMAKKLNQSTQGGFFW